MNALLHAVMLGPSVARIRVLPFRQTGTIPLVSTRSL
jgi:hypothetical protein